MRDAILTARRWLAALVLALSVPGLAVAAQSEPVETEAMTVRLVTAETGVAAGTGTVSAGVEIDLAEGWKTYWRSPGEVGFPPEIDWSGSENVAGAEMLWPAPERFRAFGIENYGYSERVVFPLRVTLDEPGEAARLDATVRLLACEKLCVPQEARLVIDLPAGGGGIDAASAEAIADFAARVPAEAPAAGLDSARAAVSEDGGALVVTVAGAQPFDAPALFPETPGRAAFGAPDIRLSEDGRALWARLPVTSPDPLDGPVTLTVTDGARAAEFPGLALAAEAPPPPHERAPEAGGGALELLWIAGLALLGGVVLNAMPCVLPVLSIKLASAMKARDRGRGEVRAGFLVSALGVLAFMWLLAGATLAAKAAGIAVGWGLQFQNPVFLAVMVAVLGLFTANLAGAFEIALPASWSTAVDRAERRGGYLGDFATGAFAAVLATPCSAPFLGTAIAFALAGSAGDVLVVFTALGAGLALPYLAVAARPGLVAALPKPGRWMIGLKLVLGALLGLTAAWLLWVLAGVAGPWAALAVAAAVALAAGLLGLSRWLPGTARGGGAAALLVVALAAPGLVPEPPAREAAAAGPDWVAFDRGGIARAVAAGETVFVDVTADWCLTCKANKALVLDRAPVAGALAAEGVTAMRADWTRPDDAISRYLAGHDRYAIPFNAVYGPGAPEGIVLPELLSADAVIEALDRAAARDVATGG